MSARELVTADTVALLERVTHQIREGVRPMDPELVDALRHEIERRPEPQSPDVPDWQWALVQEALDDVDANDDNVDFRKRFAEMRADFRLRRRST